MKRSLQLVLLGAALCSCAKKETHSPAVSLSGVNALKAFAGHNRIKLSWNIPDEEQAASTRIYWNGSDSLDVPVKPGAAQETILSPLAAGTYPFTVRLVSSTGQFSAPAEVTGRSYGDAFADALKNRAYAGAVYQEDGSGLLVTWIQAAENALYSDIAYRDSTGRDRALRAPANRDSILLPGLNGSPDSQFVYRTFYLPEPLAIDTFASAFDTVKVPRPNSGDWDPSYTRAVIRADGPGDTYELLNRSLGGTAEETPDCAHPSFGRHITEEYNSDLGENVFAFFLHVTPDNDRCVNFDRQRCEIKTYGPSPDSMKAFRGDKMIFTWKFRLDADFQPSSSFTHIHQIKAGDGPNDGSPLITLTPRYGKPDHLQLIHTGDSQASTQGTVGQVDLAPLLGVWVQAVEKITFDTHGSYSLVLTRVDNGTVLMEYTNNDIDLWRTGSTFIRPKWGIYRSLNDSERLRDEKVLFADFVIGKKR